MLSVFQAGHVQKRWPELVSGSTVLSGARLAPSWRV
jgi:hypothetical protein